jgi:WD40 repeat protein
MVAWSPDGALIASVSTDLTQRVWDVAGGKLLATRPHRGSVDSVVWTPDGTRVFTASEDGHARVWDVHRDTHTLAELDELETIGGWRLVDGKLELATSTYPLAVRPASGHR